LWSKIVKIFRSFTKTELKAFVIAFLLAIFSLVFLAIIYFNHHLISVPVSGGEFTQGVIGQPTNINPVTARSEVDQFMVHLIFSNLTSLTSSIQPDASDKVWSVRLNDGLRWQDGQKLTSDDVIFTVDSIQEAASESPLFQSWQGVVAKRVSELEVDFVLPAPYAFFNDILDNLYILPKHLYANVPVANWRLSDYNLSPIGSGPYEFVGFKKQPNGYITDYFLKANNHYFGSKPLIQNLNIKFFNNEESLTEAFNNGQIDGLGGFISNSILQGLERPYDLYKFQIPYYYAVFFNQNANPILQDINVRKALSLVVDRNKIIDSVFGGNAVPVTNPLPSFIPDFSNLSSSSSISNSLASSSTSTNPFIEASNLLDADGWKLSTSTNYRQKLINGSSTPLQLTLTVPQDDNSLIETAKILVNDWQNIGVSVQLNVLSSSDIQSAIKYRNYQMIIFGEALNPIRDLYAFWDSNEINYPGLNLALYSNKSVDSLLDNIRHEPDQSNQNNLLSSLKQQITGDYPAVFLYSPYYLYVASKNLRGIEGGFIKNQFGYLDQISNWFVYEALSFKK